MVSGESSCLYSNVVGQLCSPDFGQPRPLGWDCFCEDEKPLTLVTAKEEKLAIASPVEMGCESLDSVSADSQVM